MANVRAWFEDKLRSMLGFDEVEDIAKFALDSFSVSQPEQMRQYLEQMLGESNDVRNLCDELSARRRGAVKPTPATAQGAGKGQQRDAAGNDFWGAKVQAHSSGAGRGTQNQRRHEGQQSKGKAKGKVYQKSAVEEDFWGTGTASGRSGTTSRARVPKSAPAPKPAPIPGSASTSVGATKGHSIGNTSTKMQPRNAPERASSNTKAKGTGDNKGRDKPSAKRAPAGTTETKGEPHPSPEAGEPVPGWSGVSCQCMGKKHDVITNCLSCGKIACTKEGGFGCSFCGSPLPSTGREPRVNGASDRGSEAGGAGAESDAQSEALKQALARKERLLLFDRTSASRTRVLDDQGDYFSSHNWLSREEREKGEAAERARRDETAQRRGARRQVKLSIDIMGRRVIEAQDPEEVNGNARTDDGLQYQTKETAGPGHSVPGASAAGEQALENTPSGIVQVGDSLRPSLENLGLQGRAKEVYDVMRANLAKQDRQRPSDRKGSRAGGGNQTGLGRSRLSLWRVQHDVDTDDNVRSDPTGGGSRGNVVEFGSGRVEKFEPGNEIACS